MIIIISARSLQLTSRPTVSEYVDKKIYAPRARGKTHYAPLRAERLQLPREAHREVRRKVLGANFTI